MKVLPFSFRATHDKTIIVQEDSSRYFYPHLHRHKEIQLTLIEKGEGTLLIGNKMYPFGPNEVYLIGTNVPHVFRSEASYFSSKSGKRIYAISIFFNTNGRLASLLNLPELICIYSFFGGLSNAFRIPESSFGDISCKIQGVKSVHGVDQLVQFCQLLKSLSSMENMYPLVPDSNLARSTYQCPSGLLKRNNWKNKFRLEDHIKT